MNLQGEKIEARSDDEEDEVDEAATRLGMPTSALSSIKFFQSREKDSTVQGASNVRSSAFIVAETDHFKLMKDSNIILKQNN